MRTRNTGQRQLCRVHCCRLTAIGRHRCCALEGGKSQLSQLHLLLHLSPDRAILLITRLGLMFTAAPPFVLVLPATVAVAPLIVSLLLAAPLVPIRRQRAATCNNARTIGASCDCLKNCTPNMLSDFAAVLRNTSSAPAVRSVHTSQHH